MNYETSIIWIGRKKNLSLWRFELGIQKTVAVEMDLNCMYILKS